jgi:hypothetical protein
MSWILAILGAIAAALFGMYQLGPGMNKRKESKKQKEWTKKWKDNKGGW